MQLDATKGETKPAGGLPTGIMKRPRLHSKTLILFVGPILLFTLLQLRNIDMIHSSDDLQVLSRGHPPQEQQPPQPALPQSSLLTDLLHLYETLPEPNVTSGASPLPFREVSYAFLRRKTLPSDHITLTTQISISKFPRLLNLLERWNGPISCAVHLPNPADIQTLCKLIQHQNQTFYELVTLHVMLEKPSPHFYYPINRLRNLALHNIDTNYFFNDDVDFMPTSNAHDDLVRFLSDKQQKQQRFSTLWVLPAFERFGDGKDRNRAPVKSLDLVPKTKQDLLSMLHDKKVAPFHEYYPKGHAPTDYEKWYRCPEGDTYPITWDFIFEPYVIGNRYGIPNFVDRYRGFGSNKASWIMEAHFKGYQFKVLCTHFVVHMNHPGRKGRTDTKSGAVHKWFTREYMRGRYNMTKTK